MPKKRPPAPTFADLVAAMPAPPEDKPEVSCHPMPVADGCHWRLTRGPLDPRRAKRLAVTADRTSMGVAYDDRAGQWLPRFLGADDRPAAWLAARARFGAAELPIHETHEFTDGDGHVLLFVETYC
ncbi:hypothetical protein ACFYS8_01260 [Kitasatospora sp. NPDC004615]|uniref:hypothetical protein n=1 Tax=Kitasatospora sp. NPDC004615 TaxID=3364017 RepID=UPI00369945DB